MKNKNIDHISDQCVCLQQTVWTFFFLFFFFLSLYLYIPNRYIFLVYKEQTLHLEHFFPLPSLE